MENKYIKILFYIMYSYIQLDIYPYFIVKIQIININGARSYMWSLTINMMNNILLSP
jgi:hypothetical protein